MASLEQINCTTNASPFNNNENDNSISEDSLLKKMYVYIWNFSMQVLSHISGSLFHVYWNHCDICIDTLLSKNTNILHKFIIFKDKGGSLYPSDDVIKIYKDTICKETN